MSVETRVLERVVLVGAYLKGEAPRRAKASLEELVRLTETAGGVVAETLTQRVERFHPGTLIRKGKIQEVAEAALRHRARTIIFDSDLSPAQQKQLEGELKTKIIDRTRLILDIFAQRARTREGELQVEHAQLSYMLPRLTGSWRGFSQQVGGIGTRGPWLARLSEAGVQVEDHALVQLETANGPAIHRHRAAIHRDGLSAPIQALLTHGLIKPGLTVFDYGCGRGSDIRGLRDLDVQASGWDPYYAPEAELKPADVVNLGFVLNVIERPQERVQALRSAFGLAGCCLAIAVILPNAARWLTGRPYGDGVLTRLGTFQKFFTAAEVKTLVEQVLEREAFAVSPGVFFVFRDADAEQAFLLRRQDWRRPTVWSTARREERLSARKEALGAELDRIVELALELGRWPFADELDDDIGGRIRAAASGENGFFTKSVGRRGRLLGCNRGVFPCRTRR